MKSTNHFRLVTLVVFFIGLSSIAAFAQTDTRKSYVSTDTIVVIGERETKIPIVNTIATKLPVALRQTPASVGVVTSALIENQGAIVVGDALRNVSGVNAQTGFGVFDYFMIRGFESVTSGLVLTDGAAEPEITFYNLYNVDRVEVLKGPGAFLYGANPLSGTVNLVRKQPIFRNFLHLGSSYGRFDSYRSTADFGLADSRGRLAFRLNALWQNSESFRDDKDNENLSVNPALTWRLSEKTSLTANFERVKSKYKPDTGLPLLNNQVPDVPRTQSYQLPSDISDQKILRGRLDFETRLSESFTLRNKFYYTDLDWQSHGTLLLGAFPTPFGTVVARALNALDDRQKLAGNQMEAVLRFNTGNVRHQILAGFEVNRLGDEFTLGVVQQLSPISLVNPVETTTSVTPSPFMETDARSITYAPYALNQIAFSEKLQATLGGRFDAIDYEDTRTLFIQGFPVPASANRNYEKFSPMLGLVFSPTANLSFYANTGKAFGPPSTLVVGNVEAEESTQYEVGAKTQFYNGRLHATVAAYHLKKNNLTISSSSSLAFLAGKQKSRGLELELMAEPVRQWQTFIAYAFTEPELTEFIDQIDGSPTIQIDRSGNVPAFAPKHILNVWTNKTFGNRFGVGLGGRYLSEQFIDEDNAYKIDGFFTLDAMLYYQIGNWRWSLNAKNLTDTEYETRGFSLFYSASVLPGNPRAIYGQIEFRL
ncbi:MAG: TonB-dependent receptor [candidate division KSB1 bacterium]|nr:TonB-dependent receptor [candidate division KSB1 bacterium]MDZ7365154.1 TonB-dependent receptor [candidate division KSB1 bacterium]MDZ7404364.1 TonB-dependent receptor [candidate division KSB1 bacterium]